MTSSTSRLSNDLVHLLNLSLSTAESTEFLLSELTGTLFLRVTEKFDNTSLVRSKTSNLVDDITNKSVLGRKLSLSVETGSRGSGGDLVSLVSTNGDSCLQEIVKSVFHFPKLTVLGLIFQNL